jgi:bacterioferritin
MIIIAREKAFDSLNKLLQGEYMAVNSINTFISRIADEHVKKVFQDVQDNHRDNIKTLATYIQSLGGYPEENIGLKGKMATMKIDLEIGREPDPSKVLQKALKGERNGINMAEKVLRGKLDDQSRDLAGEILHKDRVQLDKLQNAVKSKQ